MDSLIQSARRPRSWIRLLAVLALSIISWSNAPAGHAYPFNPLPAQPGFANGKVFSGAAVDYGSPTLADLNGDGSLDIIFGGRDGKVYAVDPHGNLLWQFDAVAAINAVVPHPGTGKVDSAPAVADVDGDGLPEIAVSIASSPTGTGMNGGVVLLHANGTPVPGWPQVGLDLLHDGYTDGFYSSPALGDLDGDGKLEIVAASWDMNVYAWHYDGRLVKGWPRFVFDTAWSSPALADVDGDGRMEVAVGTDTGNLGPGGVFHLWHGDGQEMPGFPKHIDQTFYASPAFVDLNSDGLLDIVTGTGNYYAGKGFMLYAWQANGNPVPGWPVATGGYMMSSPAAGDIDGDGKPEVIAGSNDGKVYAFEGNGTPVPGWPVTIQDNLGNTGPLNFSSPVLANFDADAQPEIFINHFCDVVVLDGNGTELTHVGSSGPSGKPNMYMFSAWCLGNTSAVGDIDQDGQLEIVRAGGNNQSSGGNALLYVWKSNRGTPSAPWPMYRRDAAHNAAVLPQTQLQARVVSQDLPAIMSPGATGQAHFTLQNTGTSSWTAATLDRLGTLASDPLNANVCVPLAPGETIAPGQVKTFTAVLHAPTTPGFYTTSWRMVREGVRWFGFSAFEQIKVGNIPALYVLTKQGSGPTGGVYAGGLAWPVNPPAVYTNWPAAKRFGFLADFRGYQMLDYQGGVWQGGTAQPIGGHGFVPNAQALLPKRVGPAYYIVDQFGNLTNSYGATLFTPAPPVFGDPRVRDAVLTPNENGLYVLDAYGNVYTGGSAPRLAPATPGFGNAAIAQRIKLTRNGTGYYVLDAYGRLWNGGTAPALAPKYALHLNEDWARAFELTANEQGYYLLDKEGGIHVGGTAAPLALNWPPTWLGQDVALDLALADSQVSQVSQDLLVTPDRLSFMMPPGQRRTTQLQLGTSGAALNWSAHTDQPWLTINVGTGLTPAPLLVTANAAGLTAGTQLAGTVTIESPGAGNAPIQVPVALTVVDLPKQVDLPLIIKR